jgi:hypothetical protein
MSCVSLLGCGDSWQTRLASWLLACLVFILIADGCLMRPESHLCDVPRSGRLDLVNLRLGVRLGQDDDGFSFTLSHQILPMQTTVRRKT